MAHGIFVSAGELLVPACGIECPNQGLDPGPLRWEHGVLTSGPAGKTLRGSFESHVPGLPLGFLSSCSWNFRMRLDREGFSESQSTPPFRGAGLCCASERGLWTHCWVQTMA